MLRSKFIPFLSLTACLTAQDAGWLGTWKLASTPNIGAAIERCTDEMSFIKRPIARSRLKKLNPAYQRIVLTRVGGEFVIQFEERQPIRLPADGKAVAWTREDGEKFLVSARPSVDALAQHYQGEDGERDNRFRVDPGGKALTLDVIVKSQKLPKPLTYSITYSR